jgi:hypothetical protein
MDFFLENSEIRLLTPQRAVLASAQGPPLEEALSTQSSSEEQLIFKRLNTINGLEKHGSQSDNNILRRGII